MGPCQVIIIIIFLILSYTNRPENVPLLCKIVEAPDFNKLEPKRGDKYYYTSHGLEITEEGIQAFSSYSKGQKDIQIQEVKRRTEIKEIKKPTPSKSVIIWSTEDEPDSDRSWFMRWYESLPDDGKKAFMVSSWLIF
jgi:hypothetical protein